MAIEKRTIEGRDFWFLVEPACKEDPDTCDFTPTDQYYCALSAQELGPTNQGDVLKDDSGRARLFPTAKKALDAGVREVEARLRLPPRAYAVGLPYATKQPEQDAYAGLIKRLGSNGANGSRVADSYGRRWLRVWTNREEAERFAARLRQETRNRDWEVYDLSPPPPADERSSPAIILVGRQSDGTTYGLHPKSLNRLRRQFPEVRPRSTVFIGGDPYADHEAGGVLLCDQVAVLLTGLSLRQLNELGGYRVVDPLTNLVLRQSEIVAG